MSNLTDRDKRYLEALLNMGDGYVLDYTDATFDEFFRRYAIDIHGSKYQTHGTSKAKKLRAFWEQESDSLVGSVLSEMLESYEVSCDLGAQELDKNLLKKCRNIVARLTGTEEVTERETTDLFLGEEFAIPNVHKLPVAGPVATLIKERLNEVTKAYGVGAYLSVIFLCGSVLEGVLLGAAEKDPGKFNKSLISPKCRGKVKPFQQWTLAELINVAHEIGLLKLDVKRFSHGLRDFRNYIHPYAQVASGFKPDEHTARVCYQVLKAALASLAGER